jgi:plastocyanin
MNKIVIFTALILVVSLVGCAQQQATTVKDVAVQKDAQQPSAQQTAPQPAANEKVAISIKNFAFNPATLEISAGTTVKWTNDDSVPHALTSENFKSGTLNNGDSYEFRFVTPGIYDYSCSIHPSMKGKITVK